MHLMPLNWQFKQIIFNFILCEILFNKLFLKSKNYSELENRHNCHIALNKNPVLAK